VCQLLRINIEKLYFVLVSIVCRVDLYKGTCTSQKNFQV